MAKIALDPNDITLLMSSEKQYRNTFVPCPTSSTRTVNIRVDISRRVKLHHKIYIFNINSTSSNIGSYQNIEGASTKSCQSRIALLLTYITMQSLCSQTLENSARYQVISLALSFSEHNSLSKDLLLHSMVGALALCYCSSSDFVYWLVVIFVFIFFCGQFLNPFHVLRNLNGDDIFQNGFLGKRARWHLDSHMTNSRCHTGSALFSRSINRNNILLILPSNLLYPWRRGGRKQHHLRFLAIIFSQSFQNGFDIVSKSHGQHFISLVQNDEITFVQSQISAFQMVDDASRSPDENIQSLTKRSALWIVRHSAMKDISV
mmetsp:Transcript_9054/g.16432  ORF Transcript_9054/g.16432 Transcript_9054/m.16432 type:complete len:318 (+) Transcript_9054:1189-2142(+)